MSTERHPDAGDGLAPAPLGELWANRLTAIFGMEAAQRVLETARARAQGQDRPFWSVLEEVEAEQRG